MKAYKLPSGSWRCVVYLGTDSTGKKIQRSVTASTKREAERLAAEAAVERVTPSSGADMTLGDAVRRYIAARTSVLSPGTIAEYTRLMNRDLVPIADRKLISLTAEDIQIFINEYSASRSAKSVLNLHGFLSSVLKAYRPSLKLDTKLPQRQKASISIPTAAQLRALVECSDGITRMIIVLNSRLGLRRAELCALRWSDIDGDVIHVRRSMAQDLNHQWIEKSPKTTAGTREVPIPPDARPYLVMPPDADPDSRVVPITPDACTRRFERACKKCGLTGIRLHDLRHYYASVMLALGVPDKYAMSLMGHATPHMLQTVYQHTMDERMRSVYNSINSYFDAPNPSDPPRP